MVPKLSVVGASRSDFKAVRNRNVYAAFLAGANYAELARRFSLSRSRAHRIVAKQIRLRGPTGSIIAKAVVDLHMAGHNASR